MSKPDVIAGYNKVYTAVRDWEQTTITITGALDKWIKNQGFAKGKRSQFCNDCILWFKEQLETRHKGKKLTKEFKSLPIGLTLKNEAKEYLKYMKTIGLTTSASESLRLVLNVVRFFSMSEDVEE